MDLLHNLTPSVSRSSPPPPAFRQATMPVSVAPGQVAPFTCGCQWKLLLFSLYFSFSFSTCYLAFYVALQRFATPHSAQQHAAAQLSAVVAATFRCLLSGGWQVFARLLSSTGKTLAVCCQIECDSLRSVLVNRRRETERERGRVVVPGRCKL